MIRKLLFLFFAILTVATAQAQVVSIVGTGVNGWPPTTGPEIDLQTSDNITYTLTSQQVNTGVVKFRLDHLWDTNWGSPEFPTGTGTNNGQDIPTVAGTYDVTFNRITGAYSFVGVPAFPSIGIWGPAVDAINGFVGPDVNMTTTDGIIYKLSAFNFTSGSANFRQNDNPATTFSSMAFPTGTAVPSGPNFFVTGGQWTVYFNRVTGDYSFEYPSVGIIGSFNDWTDPDVNLTTTNGETYTLENFTITDGFCKLRLDDEWTVNWGGDVFPNGTLILNGGDMAVFAGTYDLTFNRSTRNVNFVSSLGINNVDAVALTVYPNPSSELWNFSSSEMVVNIQVFDILGNLVCTVKPQSHLFTIPGDAFKSGVYFARITTQNASQTFKLIKE